MLAGLGGFGLAGRVPAVPANPPTPEAIAALNPVEHVAISPDGLQVAYLVGRESHRDGAEVRELWLVACDGSQPPRRLLARTEHVAEMKWSPDGLALQGLLLKPPGFDPAKRYPLITEIHGGPRRSWWATSLLLYGAADSKVPPGQAAVFYNPWRSFGVPVEAYVYPDAGHGFTDPAHKADVLRRVAAWFERWLGPAASG